MLVKDSELHKGIVHFFYIRVLNLSLSFIHLLSTAHTSTHSKGCLPAFVNLQCYFLDRSVSFYEPGLVPSSSFGFWNANAFSSSCGTLQRFSAVIMSIREPKTTLILLQGRWWVLSYYLKSFSLFGSGISQVSNQDNSEEISSFVCA